MYYLNIRYTVICYSLLPYLISLEYILKLDSKVSWLKANVGVKGFYVVNYDTALWESLVAQLRHDKNVSCIRAVFSNPSSVEITYF